MYKRQLERLKKLFLFEDDAMSEKEYLMSKRELEGTLSDIENEPVSYTHLPFLNATCIFISNFSKGRFFLLLSRLIFHAVMRSGTLFPCLLYTSRCV